MKKQTILLAAFGMLAILVTSCADVTPIQNCVVDTPYGFWSGLWHGIILPFSFIGSLFSDDIAIYAVNNNGHFYNLGFVLGALSGTFTTIKSKRK